MGLTGVVGGILIYSLLCVCASDFPEPDLWGILGALPSGGPPEFICLTLLHLARNYLFLGFSEEEFKTVVMGLEVTPDGDIDTYA